MHRLLYISSSRVVPTTSEVEKILRVSRRRNADVGVTGLLVVGGRRFLQALEGPLPVVEQTYERIARDPRHFALVELSRQPIEERAFPGWAMGYKSGEAAPGGFDLTQTITKMVSLIADKSLQAYFSDFVSRHAA